MKPLGKAFLGLVLLALVLLVLMVRLHRCGPTDAAGCGLESGFNTIIGYGLAILVGILALFFRVRSRFVKMIALGLVAFIALFAGVNVASSLQETIWVSSPTGEPIPQRQWRWRVTAAPG